MLKTFEKEQVSCRRGFCEEKKAIGVENRHQIQTEIDKNTKNQIFEKFMQFLFTFRKTLWLRISETFNKERIGCQEGFFKEINEVF